MAIEKEAFPQDSYPVQLMREYLLAYPKGFLVAESKGEIVGYIIGSLVDGQARIVSMAVSRRWRRKGIGKAMLNQVLRWFNETGFDEVRLEVRPDNAAALGLYEVMGFSRERVIPDYYETGFPAIVMKSKLNTRQK